MYVLIGVFLNIVQLGGRVEVSQQAAALGEFNSLAACQAAAAATRDEANKWKSSDNRIRFVCAKK